MVARRLVVPPSAVGPRSRPGRQDARQRRSLRLALAIRKESFNMVKRANLMTEPLTLDDLLVGAGKEDE